MWRNFPFIILRFFSRDLFFYSIPFSHYFNIFFFHLRFDFFLRNFWWVILFLRTNYCCRWTYVNFEVQKSTSFENWVIMGNIMTSKRHTWFYGMTVKSNKLLFSIRLSHKRIGSTYDTLHCCVLCVKCS